MAKAKALALLLCEEAGIGADGKGTLHGLFDKIIIPRNPRCPKLFYVFYKIDVKAPCTVKLAVLDPSNTELDGKWRKVLRDSFSEPGPIQSVWALTTTVLKQPGPYKFELRQEEPGSLQALPLASMTLMVVREQKA